jgi:hypothetical protein
MASNKESKLDLDFYNNYFKIIFEKNITHEKNNNEIIEIINFYQKNNDNQLKSEIKKHYNIIYNRLIKNNNIIKLT